MHFSGESLQNKVWNFISKYKRYFLAILVSVLCIIIGNSIININVKHENENLILQIIECQDLEKKNQYNEAYEKIQKSEKTYAKLLKDKPKLKYFFDLYQYKLSVLAKKPNFDIILNNKYISQSVEYSEFSIIGENILVQKMLILYQNHKFQECIDVYMNSKMQSLPHYFAIILKAKSLMALGQKQQALDFLNQVFLYNHDYLQNQLSSIIRDFIFQI